MIYNIYCMRNVLDIERESYNIDKKYVSTKPAYTEI